MAEWKPRGRDVVIGGVPWLARIADKARAKADGTIGDYIYPCPIDQRFLAEAGLSAEEFMNLATSAKTDDELVNAFLEKSKRKDWSSFLFAASLRAAGRTLWRGTRRKSSPKREGSMVSLWDAIRKGLGIAKEDVELGEELIEGRTPSGVGSAEDYQLGPDDGVRVSPMPVTAQSEIVVSYSGLLAKAGATELFLHCGEGPGEWRNVRDVPMEEGPQGTWTARLTAGDGGTLEFCFHDAAGNWDNNNGVNWSVTVHSGRDPH